MSFADLFRKKNMDNRDGPAEKIADRKGATSGRSTADAGRSRILQDSMTNTAGYVAPESRRSVGRRQTGRSAEGKAYQMWLCGDAHLLIDYGQIHSIASGVKAVLLKDQILRSRLPGILELIPSNTSLLISFDPRQIQADYLRSCVENYLDQDIEKRSNIVIPSRIIEFPVYFADPWTKQAVEEYCRTVKKKTYDVEFIIEKNGLSGLDDLIRHITAPTYMTTYLSMGPGLPSCVCMDPRHVLSVPKYNPPRTSTPPLSIGMGGSNISLYSTASPGGYQLFGMLAAPLLQFEQKLPDFRESPVLAKVGDRFRFRSVGPDEFGEIRAKCEEGTYRYKIDREAVFDLNAYEDSIRLIEEIKEAADGKN